MMSQNAALSRLCGSLFPNMLMTLAASMVSSLSLIVIGVVGQNADGAVPTVAMVWRMRSVSTLMMMTLSCFAACCFAMAYAFKSASPYLRGHWFWVML